MIKNFRFILILFMVSVVTYAQDSLTVTDKLKINLSPVTSFSLASKYNPAAMRYTLQQGLTDINIGYEKQTGKADLLQNGTAFDDFFFEAQSYHNDGKHHVWGSASYINKTTDNVKWNESSDYQNIYPYVLADSVGGDDLKSERYSFMGGYAQSLEQISWSIQLDYWALMEYRSVDPRPDNNTSNITLNGGVNYKLLQKYAIGGGFMLRKYKQRNTLKFANELGRPYTSHITGLGAVAHLFSNDEKACLFNGNGYGVNLQFLPINGSGFSTSLVYENFSFEKQLTNEQNIALSSINEDKLIVDISYLKQLGKHTIGVKLKGNYIDRQGVEGKFAQDGMALVEISSEKQYTNEQIKANFALLYQYDGECLLWYAKPYLSFSSMEERHKASERKMEISQINVGVKPGISKRIKKHLLHIDADLGYKKNIDSSLKLTGLSPERSITQMLQTNYDYLSSNAFFANLSAQFNYALPHKDLMIYLKSTCNYRKYDLVNSTLLEFKLGVVF